MNLKKMILCILIPCLLTGCNKAATSSESLETCSVEECTDIIYKDNLCPDHYIAQKSNISEDNKYINYEASKDEIDAYNSSTANHDTDVGLKNIKFDTAQGDLTDVEKMVAEYFNKDYLFVNNTEPLQRYNKIFDNALIQCYVYIDKIISYEGDDYTLLVNMIYNSNELYPEMDEYYNIFSEERKMIIKGTSGDSRFIVGDIIQVNGRYKGVVSENIDGISITVPTIDVYKAYTLDMNDEDSWWYVETPSRFSMLEVKNIAKCIFGEDITIRKDRPSDYGLSDEGYMEGEHFGGSAVPGYSGPCYVCILDNQSNAKFSKYRFNERYGTLEDANHYNYEISFSGDFKHFYLFMYDNELESLTLEYYDNSLNKIWKREFEGTIDVSYDVTKNNIYLVANSELHIINTGTGEDTFDSVFVGERDDVRKFKDGLLTVSDRKSDTFMFIDLNGEILWKTATENGFYMDSAQQIGETILVSGRYESSTYYYVLNVSDGTIVYDGEIEWDFFQKYG